MTTWRMRLAGPTDVAGFRLAVRTLVGRGIAPQAVRFDDGTGPVDSLFDDDTPLHADSGAPPLSLPRGYADLVDDVAPHADEARWALLYRLGWRLAADRGLWHDPLDADRLALDRMARAVKREVHKMHAFVRFRPVPPDDGGPVRHVAWFEPLHHVLDAAAPFFVRRFPNLHWAILTPRGCVAWDGRTLQRRGPADPREAPPPDAGEALWLAYYRSIFNPARLKVAMMTREMPVRFWRNLPEAAQVPALVAGSAARTGRMVEAGGTERQRRAGRACPSPGGDDVANAERAADSPAERLRRLQAEARACDACPLHEAATQVVWGRGPAGAPLMLVGEQPGDHEDLAGEPFVGPAGQLLQRAMAELGWPAERLYLTNAVKHFKYLWRGKRRLHKTAAQREAEACAHWLEAEIDAVGPQAIVALGATAARSLLGAAVPVGDGMQWYARPDGRPVLVTWHPAALLRSAGFEHGPGWEAWLQALAQAGRVLHDPSLQPLRARDATADDPAAQPDPAPCR